MKPNRDLWGLGAAFLLLVLSAAWFLWTSRRAGERREAVAASVPEFPRAGHGPASRRGLPSALPRPAADAPRTAPRTDTLDAFVLAGSPASAGVVSVNALLNTPLFARIRECTGKDFGELERAVRELGLDLDRDVDRLAFIPGSGMAVSGFFEGKPVAERMMSRSGTVAPREYRGARIYEGPGQCTAQLGNLVLVGNRGGCEGLVDRAQTPPATDAREEIYGDVWMRTDLTRLPGPTDADPRLSQLLEAMKTVTLRANVWDSVALTLEGTPRGQRSANELIHMARGAISLAKTQIDEEDVELAALADMASVQPAGSGLQIDLAIPSKDLFDRLHFPCPTAADAGP